MATQTQRVFTVEPEMTGFPVNFCFNQYSVDRDGADSAVVSFGYVFKGRLLDDVFSCAIPLETIELGRKDTLAYLGRTGEIVPIELLPIRPSSRVVAANVIGMAHRGQIAETVLHNFPFRLTVGDQRGSTLTGEPVALLRSPLNVQRNLIRALYQ